ncbi:MAG: hypothetical protein PVH87_05490 [Desulfobacteraceae bacterium]
MTGSFGTGKPRTIMVGSIPQTATDPATAWRAAMQRADSAQANMTGEGVCKERAA